MNRIEASPRSHKLNNYLLLLLCSITMVVLVATIVSVTGKGQHEPASDTLSVNDGRPVEKAAEELEKKYGWIISYEDSANAYEGDLVDVTEKVSRNLDKFKPGEAPRVFVPKGGELSFSYTLDPDTQKPADSFVVVQQLLNAYASGGNPGVFRLDRDGERLHIVPVAAKNKDGVLVSRQSVLDVSITLPAQKRNGLELLNAFCAAVSEASGTRVLPASAPLNLFHQYKTEAGAKDQKARDFLTHELDAITGGAKLSWKLLYSAREKTYYFSIYPVSTR
jgi:hypothetical protein